VTTTKLAPAEAPQPPPVAPAADRGAQPREHRGERRDSHWAITPAIAGFLREHAPETPCLVVDGAVVTDQYRRLQGALPGAAIFYAVKANPAVVPLLARLGSSFDVASPGEVDLCLRAGVDPARISYGNPVKKHSDIVHAHRRGVRRFCFDCGPELKAIAAAAPGSLVICRILTSGEGADWPLSRKFGCRPGDAVELLVRAKALGLVPEGISFHVGSQQRDPGQWGEALQSISSVVRSVDGLCPTGVTINLGGGLPGRYVGDVPPLRDYAREMTGALRRHVPQPPAVMIEPGRYLVADAGVILSQVVRVRPAAPEDGRRWVYLDVGRFSGLAETEGEAIRYPILTPHDGGPDGAVVLAGPTCDSADILYDSAGYRMPLALRAGDCVHILSAGAYTATYASVGFNGFPPPRTYVI